MEFLELARRRYSVRKYEARKVEEEKVLKILEAGRIAPTAANYQPHSIIVVQEQEGLDRLKKCANIYGAPLAMIICGDHNLSWKRPFDGKDVLDIDISIVTDHMMLQAADLGLGSVWICYFDPEILRKEFDLPEHIEAVNILAVGYPAGESAPPDRHSTTRKPLQEIVHYEKY
ncbi:nitroreductase family protein [Geosporobacter ferrireducens]|uniref:nitroreductase family protein n=1 Tax=Geosporobacter ferrireducens TaxID=1424294 RepID=UPI00139ED447|nr:nitroreductase family protein [Geosporobacter ferrireducens]MTI57472.1 nitroreductase [Geosporobacter ferrireducens]